MNRRAFLHASLGAVAAVRRAAAQSPAWRTFAVSTRVEPQATAGAVRLWLPLASAVFPDWQRVIRQSWTGNAPVLRALRDEGTGPGLLFAEWPAGDPHPEVQLTLTIAVRDRAADWRDITSRGAARASLQRYLRPTRLLPIDGIVRDTARRITRGEAGDVARARAIYEWIVENTTCDPAVRGSGVGDVRAMLESGRLRGASADLNALFVALARAAGVPARDVYGVRVAESRMFSSLGRSGDVTSGQHCRAEFHSTRHGWVPVDPADVRRVILEERGGLDLTSSDVAYARRQLFGNWEMNWIAFNDAHDVALPEASGGPLPFFMYPQAEAGGRRLDSLAPDTFRYRIEAREI